MTAGKSEDELVDLVVDRVMRGQDPNVEALITDTPELSQATREKLRKIAGIFAPSQPGETRNTHPPVARPPAVAADQVQDSDTTG